MLICELHAGRDIEIGSVDTAELPDDLAVRAVDFEDGGVVAG